MTMSKLWWGVAAGLLLGATPVMAQTTGEEQWELTFEMQTEGMSLPPTTQKVCKPPAKNERDDVPTEKDCKVLDFKRSGSKTTYTIQCDGERGKFTGTGEMEWQGKDAYRGKMRMTGTSEGRKFDMTQSFSGRRLGPCNSADDPARKAIAQSQAQMKEVCDKSVEELSAVLVFPSTHMPQPPVWQPGSISTPASSRTSRALRSGGTCRATSAQAR